MILPRSARVIYACLVTLLAGLICFNLYRRSHEVSERIRHDRAAVERMSVLEQLNSAAESGDTNAINHLLRSGASVNGVTGLHSSVLSTALRFNQFEAAKLLIENGANVKTSQLGTWPPLVDAAASCAQAVPLLLERGAPVNSANIRGETPLLAALENPHDKDIVPILLAHGADLKAKTTYGDTVLMRAVRARELALIKTLLQQGADVNAATKDGVTALMDAGTPEIAALLISYGARVNVRTKTGKTPLMCAQNSLVVRDLLANGADRNAKNADGMTTLMATDNTDIIQALLKYKVDVNAKDNKGCSALHYALSRNVWRCDKEPVSAKSDSAVPSDRDPTELQLAHLEMKTELIGALMKRRTEVDRKAGLNGASLRTTYKKRRLETVRLLKQAGAEE